MVWKIKIEGKPNQRIDVVFNPTEESLSFIGAYKPKNKPWVVFSEAEHKSHDIDLEQLQEKIFEAYEILAKRVEQYEELAKGMALIKDIAVEEEEKQTEDNFPYTNG